MRLKETCTYCGKIKQITSEVSNSVFVLRTYACGHVETIPRAAVDEETSLRSVSGHTPRPYQIQTLDFIEKSGYRCGVFHEQGLGKTICALLPLRRNPQLYPFAVLCKAGLTRQWAVQISEWLGDDAHVQIIQNGKVKPITDDVLEDIQDLLPPEKRNGTKRPNAYVISMDSLKTNPHLENGIDGIQYIIIDECQAIKNLAAKRTSAVQNFVRACKHVVPMSGTPFYNNAKEYFPTLNIIKPSIFYSEENFTRQHVSMYYHGNIRKYGGLRHPKEFKELTKDFIIRFTRDEVMPELPKINRQFTFVDLTPRVAQEYGGELDTYLKIYNSSKDTNVATNHDLRASLFRLWHIVGLAKLPHIIREALDFLEENPDKRLTIFHHHKDVGDILESELTKRIAASETLSETTNAPLRLASDSPHRQEFAETSTRTYWVSTDPKDRVLIVATKVGGEGLNLQKCEDMIQAEREWTPMSEEQCEGRFSRIGSTASSIFAQYVSAVGTIDDFFYELDETKRKNFHEAMSGEKENGGGIYTSLMQDLADALARNGKKKFDNREKVL